MTDVLATKLLKKLIRKGLGFGKIRQTVSGAAPIQVSLIEWFRSIGIYITNGYGMTENCVICTAVDGKNIEKTGSGFFVFSFLFFLFSPLPPLRYYVARRLRLVLH